MPKTKQTRSAYEVMLNVIQQQLGGEPLSIVSGAADEILAVLKDDSFKNPDKKKEIEKLLNPIPNHVFDQLVSIGRLITDYPDGSDAAGPVSANRDGALDDDIGVAVEFEENEEEEENDLDMIKEDEEDEHDVAEPNGSGAMQMDWGIDDDYLQENDGGMNLNVQDIDAYWLQRKISQAYGQQIDPQQCQNVAEESNSERAAKEFREEAHRLGGSEPVQRDMDNGGLTGQSQLLDLDSIAFQRDSHLMANDKCVLPDGSYRHLGKGYEEIYVPKLTPKPFDSEEKFVKIASMPDWAQLTFKGMTQLNSVQSKVYETALFKADNVLLCAPTGAGKTNVAVLTILQQIALHSNPDGSYNHNEYKIVYVAPMKALVAEIVGNLSKRLQDYGVKVRELSGDQTLTCQQIEETQIIVTTPEKWDIITRKSGDCTYTQLVKLLIIDEIHLLHDNRGPVLESIVSRTVRQIETTQEHIRLVGLSATLPNYENIALFLRVDPKKGMFHFDNSYRPVPLSQLYIGITVKKPLQRFQLMNDLCYQKVTKVAGKHQVLIFVHSRKETSKTARAIRDAALANDTLSTFLKEDGASREILHTHTDLVKSNDLKDLLPYGFAIHHAGMTRVDRQLVEELFRDGHIQVLVSTATLAWGVNLPAHTVIIKGTQIYNPEKGAWTALSPLDVMQMLGRAGDLNLILVGRE
ncbi:unnamed protein product [Citrullus colocynthis]|uniref:Uncharacterized protein n=1 Tax=Citrullus colocynthis TaxID=252529 RepID=A0ABP0Z1I9_9ROSI